MTEKQYQKADARVLPTVLIVMGGIFLNVLGMVASQGGTGKLYATLIACVLGIIVDIIVYKSTKGTRKCGVTMLTVASVVYVCMVVCVDVIYFYMLVAAIYIINMAYLEVKRLISFAAVVFPLFVGKCIYLMILGMASTTEVGTTIVIMLFIMATVHIITKILIVFNDENMGAVQAGAEQQKKAAERMTHVSENIISNFDEANAYVNSLTEALDTSNLSMQNIASNVENTAQALQEQSQMCLDIQNNTENAKAQTEVMAIASEKALEEVSQGAVAMEQLHNHAQDVEKDSRETVEYVTALNERTKEVENILGTIVSISNQTNLLALNASIEAARAGEAGKGFAVVADEIRELSEQTQAATESITEILNLLGKDVDSVTTSVNHSVEIVEQQNQLIDETKMKFGAIDVGVNELITVIEDFQQVIGDITESTSVIAEGITGLSANSEEVAATADEGTRLMNNAVNNMGQVNTTLTNIYDLAQELQQD